MTYLECLSRLKQIGGISEAGKLRSQLSTFLCNVDPDLYTAILDNTRFLRDTASLRERIYCIVHDIIDVKRCPICNQPVAFNSKGTYSRFCSTKCSSSDPATKQKMKQTNIDRYGVEHANKLEVNKHKIRSTNMGRYSVQYPTQSPHILEKIRNTVQQTHGTSWITKTSEFKQRARASIDSKFGVPHPMLSDEIRTKFKQTCLERHGVSHPMQNGTVVAKRKETNIARYGHECSVGNRQHEFINHKQQTSRIKYGVSWYTQRNIQPESLLRLDDKDWLYEQYVNQYKTSEFIGYELGVAPQTVLNYLKKHDIPRKLHKFFSYRCIAWLNGIETTEHISIQHAGNGGEYHVPDTRFYVDGFCAQTNTIYEFYGDRWHGNLSIFNPEDRCHPMNSNVTAGQLFEKTILREQQLKQMGYTVVSMWERDFILTVDNNQKV